MRNRTITYSLLCVILVIYITYFTALNLLFPKGQPVADQLNHIIQYAQQGNWLAAEDSANKLMDSWEKGKYLLAFNYAEADYSLFLDKLSRIQGAIKTKDAAETVSEALSALILWENFIKAVPQP